MWFYAGDGWFFRREPQDIFRIIKMSAEVAVAHPAATVQAEGEFDGETIVRLLSHLTQRSRLDVLEFLKWQEPPK